MSTDTVFPGSEGMTWHTLPADGHPVKFFGKLLSETDTDDRERLRWAELRLYRIIDTNAGHDDSLEDGDENKRMYGQPMWLLYTVGHSLVYHKLGTCQGGIMLRVADFRARAEFPDELEPCPRCKPAQDWEALDPQEKLRLEVRWYSYTPCQSAGKVIESLWRDPQCLTCQDRAHQNRTCSQCGCRNYREAPRQLSVPGHQLIEQVRLIDAEIDLAAGQEVTI
jgi:hypothetical protein